MFETVQKTLAAFAFNHIAYCYFDNVNASQLKVALEKGEVELENLPIKTDALQHFNLPVEVVSGVVGNLNINVPLFNLLTDPWTIKIRDLMIIVAPKTSSDASFSDFNNSSFIDTGQDLIEPPLDDDSANSELAESSALVRDVVSAMVRDVYKKIKLKVESMTVLFQDSDILVKFSLDSLLLHRKNIIMTNVSIDLSSMIRINFEKCDLNIQDEIQDSSETKIEGNFEELSIEQNSAEEISPLKRDILKCDKLKLDLKFNHNMEGGSTEKNLHIKLDLTGMQYLHSRTIYEVTTQNLMDLLKFFIKLQVKQPKVEKDSILNKLLVINVEEGLVFIVDDMSGPCAIPLLEFTLDDCRILQFSGRHQQNGFVFAKIGCSYFNREVSTWDTLLKPWPFNLSWDLKSSSLTDISRQISLSSDEQAEFFLSSAFLDLGDVGLKRIIDNFLCQRLWPQTTGLCTQNRPLSQDFNSVFALRNETGYRVQFLALEQNNNLELCNLPCETLDLSGGDSPDFSRLGDWNCVDVGATTSFGYQSKPIYRRHISDLNAQSRELLIRVEGWKTLPPISLNQTGVFYFEACSDRVMNEDIYIVISIDLEENSARKIISIRSPLNLVNQLETTLEVHFLESNQALYIKPDCRLAVPLPFIFNHFHIRPCNVGVTVSDQTLFWDDIQHIYECESKIIICNPITVTNQKHASYCTSRPYRICVSTTRVTRLHPIPVFSIRFHSTDQPTKATIDSLLGYKLSSYKHTVNLQSQMVTGNHHHPKGSMDLNFAIPGIDLNLVDVSRESFTKASVKNISLKCTTNAEEQILDCSVQDIRIDNLMPNCEKVIVLDRTCVKDLRPAIRLIIDRMISSSFGTTLFRQVQLTMCELMLNIEEKLILKLVEFISFRNRRERNRVVQDVDKIMHPEKDRPSKYYFDLLRIDISSVKLSVFTSTDLTDTMQRLKSYLGLKFFSFEDAQVQLAPYFKLNVSRTFKGVFESVTRFYKRQIFDQAPRIMSQQIQNYLRFHFSDLLSILYDEIYNSLFN